MDEPFGRQREPVEIVFKGDWRDIEHYAEMIKRAIEARGFDNVERPWGDMLKIYPRANND